MKEKTTKTIKKVGKALLWVVVGIFFVVIVPIFINEAYKRGPGYVTIWGAEEVLGYYGAILASSGAILGVYFSIRAAHRNYKEDVRARVLPFIAVTPFERKATVNTMALLEEHMHGRTEATDQMNEPAHYEEFKLDKIYFVVTPNGIKIEKTLGKHQQEILSQAGNFWVTIAKGVHALQRVSCFSLPIEIENVGNGTAVSLRVGFNRVSNGKNQNKYVRPMMLKQGQTVYIHIFSTETFDAVGGEYMLEFYYEDIYKNKYFQKFPVCLGKDDAGREYQSIDLVGDQINYTGDDLNANS